MKKRIITGRYLKTNVVCPLLLCSSLICTACGSDNAEAPDSDTPQNTIEDNNESQPTPDNPPADVSNDDRESEPGTDSNATVSPAESNASESDTTVSTFESNIHVEMNTEEERKTADDGTVCLIKTYTCPTVAIEGNDTAAERINSDIRSYIDSFTTDTEVVQWAKEDYESMKEEYPAGSFIPYSEDMSFKTERADSNVISFTVNYYDYTGGAHGNSITRGVNYNTKTGELISFSDLSEDPAAFHEDTLAHNQTLAKTKAYQDRMFSSDSVTDGTLESVLYADAKWYLSASGLVFIGDAYELGPYASGMFEFIIPYADLSGMGFKNAYAYTDRLVMKLLENETYHFDLNGDGQEDSVLFQSESTQSEDGLYGFLLHFIVNDTDFSQAGDDAVKEYLNAFPWGEFFLYDMNVDDDYTELVVLSGENEVSDYVYYSHFFRYTEDGTLLYLGKAKGNVSDPTAVISVEK